MQPHGETAGRRNQMVICIVSWSCYSLKKLRQMPWITINERSGTQLMYSSLTRWISFKVKMHRDPAEDQHPSKAPLQHQLRHWSLHGDWVITHLLILCIVRRTAAGFYSLSVLLCVRIVYTPGKKVLRWENINTKEKLYKTLETDQFQVADVPLKYWCEEWGALGFEQG